MKQNAGLIVGTLMVIALFGGLIWWNVSIWKECRVDHSWGYCLRLISR